MQTMNIETEIKGEIDLCQKNGSVNLEGIGWARFPHHHCNLARHWMRKKRWNYWAIYDNDFLASFTISDLDYAAVIFAYYWDRKSNRFGEETILAPFGAGTFLGPFASSPARFKRQGALLEFSPTGRGYRIQAQFSRSSGNLINADLDVLVDPGQESLNVVVPFSRNRFQFTHKLFGIPAQGSIQAGDLHHTFSPHTAFAVLDFGRGVWPYSSRWNWASMAFRRNKKIIGINLGGGWTDNTGTNENAILVDKEIFKLPEDIAFEFERGDFMQPWHIRSVGSDAVDLKLIPDYHRKARSNVGIIASTVHQMLGHFEGVVRAGKNTYEIVDGRGWAEDHMARW